MPNSFVFYVDKSLKEKYSQTILLKVNSCELIKLARKLQYKNKYPYLIFMALLYSKSV